MNQQEPPEYDAKQEDLRRNLRAPLIVEKIPCGDGRKTFFGYAKNISRGGLFVATVKPREPGDVFEIELTLPTPEKQLLHCRCEVIWKRLFERKSPHEPGMGLRFLDLTPELEGKIEEWVNEQQKAAK